MPDVIGNPRFLDSCFHTNDRQNIALNSRLFSRTSIANLDNYFEDPRGGGSVTASISFGLESISAQGQRRLDIANKNRYSTQDILKLQNHRKLLSHSSPDEST